MSIVCEWLDYQLSEGIKYIPILNGSLRDKYKRINQNYNVAQIIFVCDL